MLDPSRNAIPPPVAFFAVSNSRHFLGLVALINSLRRVGHDEPIYVVDCGLQQHERALLETHVELVPALADTPPALLKLFAPRQVAPDIAIVIDADVIVTQTLAPLIGEKLVVFADPIGERFYPEWHELGFGHVSPTPTANSGHLIVPSSSGALDALQDGMERVIELVQRDPTLASSMAAPFYLADQDVLNAYLGTLPPDGYVRSTAAAYWPFAAPLEDVRLLHHIMWKPWLHSLRPNAYSERMVTLLAGGPVRIPAELVPLHLRPGRLGEASRWQRSVRHKLRGHTRGKLGVMRKLRPGGSHFFRT